MLYAAHCSTPGGPATWIACVVVIAMFGCSTSTAGDKPTPSSSTDAAAGDAATGNDLSLRFTLAGMTPHVTQLFEYRIVDANDFIQSRGVLNPLGAPDVVIDVPAAIPRMNGPFHLDFYADVNGSGGYDGIGSVLTQDHAWRIDPLANYPSSVTPVDGLVQVTFTHTTSFTDISQYPQGTPNPATDTGLDATVQVMNAQGLQGDLIQVRIVDAGKKHTVGLFRVARITQPAFAMTIPGVVENAIDYDILVYVDANRNATYDSPAAGGGDLGWSLSGTAGATGLNVSVDAQTTAVATADVGAP